MSVPAANTNHATAPNAESESSNRDKWGFGAAALAAVLALATLVAYFPALHGGMLWDDDAHVTKPALRSLQGLWRIWTEVGATQQYYPVLHSTFWFEHRLWGDQVVGYHAINVLWHVLAALLLVAILRRLRLPGAWLAGFVFALHPVSVESVAWISEQKNTLSAVFYLAAALAYVRFDDTHARRTYWLGFGAFVLALLTKTVTATLPAALLIVIWWRRGALSWRRDVVPLLPWFLIAVPIGLFTSWVERHYIGAEGAAFALTGLQRLLLASRILCFYVGKLAWPVDLIFIYPHWAIDPHAIRSYAYPIAVVVVAISAFAVRHRLRAPLAAALFFAGTLFPALGFFDVYPFVFSYVADHFQYLAQLGVLVPLSAALTLGATQMGGAARWLGRAVGVALLTSLAVLTWREAHIYTDATTLYRTTIARNPDCWLAHFNLGVIEARSPATESAALAEYQATLRLNPGHWAAHNNLGSLLLKTPDRLTDPIAEFETAIRLQPDFAEAHNNLGIAFSRLPNRRADAIAQFEAALRFRPDYVEAHVNLGHVLAEMPERLADAIVEYRSALRIAPNDAQTHYDLANAYLRSPADLNEAIAEYQAAIRLRPDFREAHNNLASVLARADRLPEAIDEYRVALRLDPNDAETHGNLGNALLHTPGQLDQAIAEYETALRLAPTDAALHCSLGIALSDAPNRWTDAANELQRAIALRPDFAEAHYCLAVVLLRHGGRRDVAISHLEGALRANPNFAPARLLLDRLRR